MTNADPSRSRKLLTPAILTSIFLVAFLLAHHIASVQAGRNPAPQQSAQPKPPPNITPVLVELFTSEGCSSCPPADALLARLQQQQPVPTAEVIALEEHVDYWDDQGWHDRFSAHQFTDRQAAYVQRLHLDDSYTPQMIVDGADQFVGNDSAHALRAITQAARTPKPLLTISLPVLKADSQLTAILTSASPSPLPKATLYAALIEPTASTQVRTGENGGRTLRHVSVVRSLVPIGSLETLSRGPLPFTLKTPSSTSPTLRIIVFAQRDNQGTILAATSSAPFPTPSPSLARSRFCCQAPKPLKNSLTPTNQTTSNLKIDGTLVKLDPVK